MKPTTPVTVAQAAGEHRLMPRTTRRILPLGAVAGAAALALTLAACGSGSSSSTSSGSSSAPSGSTLTVADVAPFSGRRRRARPHLSRDLLRRHQRHQRQRRRPRAQAVLQERGHPRRARRRRARGQPDVRQHAQPGAGDRLHLRRSGLGRPADQRPQDGHVLHDRAVRVRPRALPVLLPAGPAGPRRVLRDGGHRPATALQADRARVRQRHRIADLRAAGHRLAQEGRDDRHHQPDARPEGHHVPHRGRGDHPVAPAGDHDRGPRHRRPHPVRRDQAAQRRQDDPDHRHLGGDLAAVLQGGGGGGRREHVRVQLPRRQPGHRDQRARLRRRSSRRCCPSRARCPEPPGTSPPT